MTKGYIVCCCFRRRYMDPGEDAIHSDTVYLTFSKALIDLRRMYNEQKDFLIQDLDEDETIVKDTFDEQRGRFTIETDYAERYSCGTIDEVNVDCDK